MANKKIRGYSRDPYVVKGKTVKPKHTGNYLRKERSKRHVPDYVEHGTYSRHKDTYGRYYGDIDYEAEEYKEKD
jgi:hypothetical protein